MGYFIAMKQEASHKSAKKFSLRVFLVVAAVVFLGPFAHAVVPGPQTITIDGRLFTSLTSDTALVDPSVVMDIKIYNPALGCILYEEKQTVDTTATDGRFTILVGSTVGSSKRVSGEPGNSMTAIFQNNAAIAGSCGAYTPAAGDTRYIRITVAPSTTGTVEVLAPDTIIDSVPNALVAETLQGLDRDHILAIDNTTTLSQTNVANVFSTTNYPLLTALLGGTSTSYVGSSTNGAKIPTVGGVPASLAQGQIWFNSSANAFQYYNGSAVQTLGIAGSGITSLTVGSSLTAGGVAGGTLNSSGTIDLVNSGVGAGTYPKVTVNSKGLVTYGTGLAESDIPTLQTAGHVIGDAIVSGTIGGSAAFYSSGNVTTTGTVQGAYVSSTYDMTRKLSIYGTGGSFAVSFMAPTMTSNYNIVFPAVQGAANTTLMNDGSGNLSWVSSSSGSVTSVGLALPSIFSVTTPVVTSTGTLTAALVNQNANFIFAGPASGGAAAPAFRGLAVADLPAGYDASVMKTALSAGQIWIGGTGGIATAVSMFGDVNLSIAGSATVTQLQGRPITAAATIAAGQVLRWDGAAWTPNYIAMGDLRSKITGALSLSSCAVNQTLTFVSTTDSLMCSNIAIANTQVAWGSTGANLVFAGPSTGGAASPTFRTLTAADLPAGTATQWNTVSTTINYIAGFVGIGTATPQAALDVYGTGAASAILIPRDTAAARPTGVNGMIRYNTTSNAVETFANGAWTTLATAAAGASQWTTNGANIYYGSGNVGVGTATPLNALDVVGNGDVQGWMAVGGTAQAETSASNPILSVYGNLDIVGGNSLVFFNGGGRTYLNAGGLAANGGGTQIFNFTNSGGQRVGVNTSGTASNFDVSGNAAFGTYGGVTAAPTNGLIVSGSVGVGTAAPQATLDVYGTGSASAMLVPRDSTAARPTGVNGMIRYNTDLAKLETYGSGVWTGVATSTSVAGSYLPLTGGTLTGAVSYPTGSVGSPAINFGDATTGFYSAGTGNLSFATAGVNRLSILANGNVGINTTNPGQLLTVYSTGANGITLNGPNSPALNVTSGGNTGYLAVASTGGAWASDSVAGDVVLRSSGPNLRLNTSGTASAMVITSSGNVGIGTASPSSLLDVNGGIIKSRSAVSNPGMLAFTSNAGTYTPSFVTQAQRPAGAELQSGDYMANFDVRNTDYTASARMSAIASETHTASAAGADFIFQTAANTTTVLNERLRISNSGRIGIGTATPQAILDVYAVGASSAILVPRDTIVNRPTGINGMIRYNTDLSKLELYGSGAWNSVATSASGGGASQWTTNGANVYYGSGNVGIGTSAPGTPLQVVYSDNNFANGVQIKNTNTGGSALAGVQFVNSDGLNAGMSLSNSAWSYASPGAASFYSNTGMIFTADNTLSATHNIDFAIGSSAPTYMRITPSGKIGIGSTTPQAILDIYATGASSAVIVPRDSSANRPAGVNGMIRYNTDIARLETYGSGAWNSLSTSAAGAGSSQWTSTGSDIYYNTGNVAIGTTVPTNPLSVALTSNATSGSIAPSVVNMTVAPPSATSAGYSGQSVGINMTNGSNFTGTIAGVSSVITDNSPATASNVYGIYANPQMNYSSGSMSTMVGTFNDLVNGGLTTNAYGSYNKLATGSSSASAIGSFTGSFNYLRNQGGGTVANAYGAKSYFENANNGTVTNAYGFYAQAPTNTGGGTFTNYYGLYIEAPPASVGNSYAIYTNGPKSYFGGNIGVGTTTPQALLDVYGVGTAASAMIVPRDTSSGRPAGINGMLRYNTTLSQLETYSSGAWAGVATGSAGTVSSQWTTSGNNIYYNSSGNVGVGTASPASMLHLANASSAGVTFQKISDHSSTIYEDGDFHVESNARKLWLNGNSSGTTSINAGGGFVGIGTYNPSYTLDIMNTVGSSNLPFMRLSNSGGGTNNTVGIILTPYSGRTGGPSSQIVAIDDGNASAHMLFYTAPNGTASTAVERLRITDAGAIGIGTTVPGAILDVNGSGTINSAMIVPRDSSANRPVGVNGMLRYNTTLSQLETYSSGAWAGLGSGSGGGAYLPLAGGTLTGVVTNPLGSTSAPSINFGSASTGIYSTGSGNVSITALGTTRVSVTATGVGIGSASPTQALDVAGTANVSGALIVPRITTPVDTDLNVQPGGKSAVVSNGNAVNITGGAAGSNAGAGGPVTITGGTANNGYSSGSVTIAGGPAIGGNGSGSNVTVAAGNSNTGTGSGGTLSLTSGNAGGFGVGGPINLTAGSGWGASGGNIAMTAGTQGNGSFAGGAISLTSGAGSGTNMPGGSITLTGGAGTGTGSTGPIVLASKVGIGTTTPGAILDINGSGIINSAMIVPRDSTANRPTTAVNGMIRYNTTSSQLESYSNGAWAGVATGGATQWVTSSSNIYYSSGNVGIGTSTVPNALTVVGDGSVSGKFAVNGGNPSGTNSIALGSGAVASGPNSVAVNWGTAPGQLSFAAGANTNAGGTQSVAMGEYTSASGQDSTALGFYSSASAQRSMAVGDHTTAPAFIQLAVGSYNKNTGSETATGWVATDPIFSVGNGQSGAVSTALMVLKNGNVGIGTIAPGAILDVNGSGTSSSAMIVPRDSTANRPTATANGMLRYNTTLSQLETYSSGAWAGVATSGTNGGASQWTSAGSNIYYSAGNVGIGTTAATNSLLNVGVATSNGSTRQTIQINEAGIGTPSADGAFSTGDKLIMWNTSGLVKNAIGNDSYGLWLQASADPSAHLSFWTGPTAGAAPLERMRINSAGNVGIGTSNPGALLDMQAASANGVVSHNIANTAGGNTGSAALIVSTYGSGSSFLQMNQGRGTSAATTATQAGDTLGFLQMQGYGSGFKGGTAILSSADATFTSTSGPGSLLFLTTPSGSTGATERMRVSGAGNVGINTTAPVAKLDISAAVNGSGPGIRINANTRTGADEIVHFEGTTSSNSFSMLANGNIGIGTSTPDSNLHVFGYSHLATTNVTTVGAQGAYIMWNLTSGTGETDFVNQRGAGSGGFYFYNATNAGAVGSAIAYINSSGTFTTSDIRLKKNLTPIENALDKILTLEGFNYNWKDQERGKDRQIGLIAQEVQKVFPEAIHEEKKGGYLAVGYDHLVAPVISALREFYGRWAADSAELHRRIDALEKVNAEKDAEIKTLRARQESQDAEIKRRLDLLERRQPASNP